MVPGKDDAAPAFPLPTTAGGEVPPSGPRGQRVVLFPVAMMLLLSGCSCHEPVSGSAAGGEGRPPACVPAPEACNGRDDDCDGEADEELAPLRCGLGGCAREVAACEAGVPGECVQGLPGIEACNGVDDDCDGLVDDGLPGESCGVGACARTVSTCLAGGACLPGAPVPELCDNGIDDDCDGADDCFDQECFDPRTIALLELGSDEPLHEDERLFTAETRGVPAPGGGYGVVYQAGGAQRGSSLRFARIDERGILVGQPRELEGSSSIAHTFELLPLPDGFRVIAARYDASGVYVLEHRRLDAGGAEASRVRLSPFDPMPPLLRLGVAELADGSGTIVAAAGAAAEGGPELVRLARIGVDGELLAGWTDLPGADLRLVQAVRVRADGQGAALLLDRIEQRGPTSDDTYRHAVLHLVDPVTAAAGPPVELYDDASIRDDADLLPLGDGTYLVSYSELLGEGTQAQVSRRAADGSELARLAVPGPRLPGTGADRLAWLGSEVGVFLKGLGWAITNPELSSLTPTVAGTTGGCPYLGSVLPGAAPPRAILAFNCLAVQGSVSFLDASVCPR